MSPAAAGSPSLEDLWEKGQSLRFSVFQGRSNCSCVAAHHVFHLLVRCHEECRWTDYAMLILVEFFRYAKKMQNLASLLSWKIQTARTTSQLGS